MKTKSVIFKVIFMVILPILLMISLFSLNSIKDQSFAASSNTSIDNYDDYIDYFRANQDEDINDSIVLIYDALVDNIETIKTGSFEFSLKSYDGFNNLVSLSEEDQNRAWLAAINALKFDDPTLFFIDFTQVYFDCIGIFVKDAVVSSENCYIDGIYNQSQLEQMLDELERKREEIYLLIDDEWTDYQKVYFVNDYIVENVEYDQTLSGDFVHTVYGSIVDGVAVCDGYSYGVQYLLDGLGITNLVCAGQAYNPSTGSSEGHMWSYVRIYDHWYGLDTTWNDPIYYGHPSQEQIQQWKVQYFLKGWNEYTGEGFYHMPDDEDERIVQNYQIYYSTEQGDETVYELPVPEIEQNDFVNPSATIETEKSMQSDITTSITIKIENVFNMLENMTFAYNSSNDGGLTWSEITILNDQQILFNQPEENGLYQFYIVTTNGQLVAKLGESVLVDIGQLYSVKIDAPEGMQIKLSPNKDAYVQNEYITLEITSLPLGMEIDSISSSDPGVTISKSAENIYQFHISSSDLTISITLKEKLYNINVEKVDGLSYTLTTQSGQSSAYYGEEVTMIINSLPKGKSLVSLGGIETDQQVEVNVPIKFLMPQNDLYITFELEDIIYNITIESNKQLSVEYLTSGIYGQEILISATNLPDNQKLMLNGIDDSLLTYISNNQISFIMPAENVILEAYTQQLSNHSLTIKQSLVVANLDKYIAYFGETINVSLSYSDQDFHIINVLYNGIQAIKINDFEYSFMMPDEDVTIEIEIFEIPTIIITNEDIEAKLQFVSEDDQFYYYITILSLPEDKIIKGWKVFDENDQILNNVIEKLSNQEFKVLLSDSDLKITFTLETTGNLYDGTEQPQEIDFLVITLIFVGVVALLSIVSYFIMIKKN